MNREFYDRLESVVGVPHARGDEPFAARLFEARRLGEGVGDWEGSGTPSIVPGGRGPVPDEVRELWRTLRLLIAVRDLGCQVELKGL